MYGDTAQNQTDQELIAWLDTIPLSKFVKNPTRDFADAVLMAEILKWYYPSHVELHNYVSASSLHAKKENWSTLNWKVFARLNMRLSKGMIHHLASASQGTIERLLWQLRIKILGNGEDVHRSRLKCSTEKEDDDVKTSKEKAGDDSPGKDGRLDSSGEITNEPDTHAKSHEPNPSKFARFKRKIFIVVGWLVRFSLVWSVLAYCRLRLFGKRDALVADATAKQVENVIEETVPRTVYADLKQELREKEELTRSLNHKIAYLESSMKLKDLRISTLSEQIPQNAVEMDQLMKPRPSDSARSKLRVLRSQNFHETKTN
ncbi:hypothetical protein DMN91_002089 [Ooceraea biroi]|uniref:CH-like domain-containing protein n=1 Tax=Ooceraea biroi TaxID=2015173 RepID=A0A3L8DZZ2_OOCBI|nr:hypothetical protein DMN91_002089 [Ooceraea biroi]